MGEGARHAVGHVDRVRLHRAGQRRSRRPCIRSLPAKPGRTDRTGSRPGSNVRRRLVLMLSRTRTVRTRAHSSQGAVWARRALLTLAVIGTVGGAAVMSSLAPGRPTVSHTRPRAARHAPSRPKSHSGEPELRRSARVAQAPAESGRTERSARWIARCRGKIAPQRPGLSLPDNLSQRPSRAKMTAFTHGQPPSSRSARRNGFPFASRRTRSGSVAATTRPAMKRSRAAKPATDGRRVRRRRPGGCDATALAEMLLIADGERARFPRCDTRSHAVSELHDWRINPM